MRQIGQLDGNINSCVDVLKKKRTSINLLTECSYFLSVGSADESDSDEKGKGP